jgi:hypothetical protein
MFKKKFRKKINFLEGHEKLENLLEHLPLRKKKKKNYFLIFLRYFLYFLIFVIFSAILIGGVLIYKGKDFYDLAVSGKINLQNSLEAAQEQDFYSMSDSANEALEDFGYLLISLDSIRDSFLIDKTGLAKKELEEINYIFKAAEISSRSLAMAANLGQKFNNIISGRLGTNFSEFSADEKERLLQFIYESGPEINGLKANLDLALLSLENVSGSGLLSPLKFQIEDARERIGKAAELLDKAYLASQLAPEIFGYPDNSVFLVLFQNSDELRPTGGFLGTYGVLEIKNGDIIRFDTHDIYHMDMPLEENDDFKIVPPEPLSKYLNKNWYMRDSNWSPDWPESAEQILWFYYKEDSLLPEKNKINDFTGKFDGVFAITPNLVTSFLELTGPLTVGGETYSAENFTELLEYKVEQDYANQNIPSWERKEVIGNILEEMKIKLFNLSYDKWLYFFEKVSGSLEKKDLLLYFKNPSLEDLAKKLGAAGEVKTVDGDYLMVVDANLAALKTDAAIKRNLEYSIEKKEDGLYANLKIEYQHNGRRDWRTDDYKSYTRIYAPYGSRLISSSGFSYEGAKTSEDFSKTVFEGFIIVPVGKTVVLDLEYKLPVNLADNYVQGRYNLYLQKQPGKKVENVKVDFKTISGIESYDPVSGAEIVDNKIIWSSDLETDKEFNLIFN